MSFSRMRCWTTMIVYYHRKANTRVRTFMMMSDTLSRKRASTTRLILTISKKNGNQSSTAKSKAKTT